ncbi:glycoside hydrolase family 32 protein [Streptomyces sp. MB09-02B]|uniref:glycoside hydrolase family 32 protein n=1 Tax=Streptomyces sp. MB09-02B TaxID=3028667 RepID=UPI0029B7A1D2|nr:glycoside hydrolase family 32 protein [Streptomyces sp. MB09-02B]MDX3645783.1 glycoside hydrolase family 32 protein [Streptomyces sp. MB09-02B]
MSAPDPHFPAAHLRPPAHWINDPNGLVFHDGHYHVFFQYNPNSARHADMHWGHYRSPDLIHWEHLPIALAPTADGDDAGGVWSGNAVSTDGRLVAFYSAKRDDRWWQPVTSAVSHDGGLTFTKHPGLLIPLPADETSMFRDPYVWRDGDRWRMLVGAGLTDGRGAAQQYLSSDLENWEYVGPFLARAPEPLPGGSDTEEGWECVQYADFGDSRGVLLLSAWDPEDGASHTAAYPGRDHGIRFAAEAPQRLDHGPDFYAPALLHAPDGRWLMWGWAWEARDEVHVGAPSTWTDEVGWAGLLSLPREVTLGADGSVGQRPARELDSLRGRRTHSAEGQVTVGSLCDLGATGRSFDLTARLHRSADGAAAAGLRLVTSPGGSEYLDITLDAGTGEIIVDRTHASREPRAKDGSWRIPRPVEAGESVDLRVVVDHSIAEIFLGTGEALTLRFYPLGEDPWHLQAHAAGTGTAAFELQAWELNPLHIQDKTDTSHASNTPDGGAS